MFRRLGFYNHIEDIVDVDCAVGSILIFGSLKVHLSTVCAPDSEFEFWPFGRTVAVWPPTSDYSTFRIFVFCA